MEQPMDQDTTDYEQCISEKKGTLHKCVLCYNFHLIYKNMKKHQRITKRRAFYPTLFSGILLILTIIFGLIIRNELINTIVTILIMINLMGYLIILFTDLIFIKKSIKQLKLINLSNTNCEF